MKTQLSTLLLALPAWLAPSASATPLVQGVGPSPTGAVDTKTSMFGDPLYVNGRRVSDDEIKLAILYGPCRAQIDLAKLGMIIEDEITRECQEKAEAEVAAKEKEQPFASAEERAKAKQAAEERLSSLLHEKYRVSDDEFEAEYQYNVDDFKKSYPVLDIGAEICRAYRSVDWYREQLRQQMYFDRVFLPANPADWPPTSTESIRADPAGGALLLPDAEQSYQSRLKAAEKNDGKLPREDPLYMTFLRQIVRDSMTNLMTFKTHPAKIDPKIALWGDANGDGKPEVALSIEELWDKVQDTVNETEIQEAKQWYISSIAVHDRLAKDGALLSEADGQQVIDELTSGFEGNTITLEQMATKTYFFPSVESFIDYFQMREGYRRMIAPKLEPGPGGELSPVLHDYFDRANRVMGLGMIDCEVLLVSAMDIPRFRWKKNGWAEAKRISTELRADVEKNLKDYNEQRAAAAAAQAQGKEFTPEKPVPEPYRFWSQLVDDHSEYWDPPPPEQHDGKNQHASDVGYKKKGRFGPRYRNDLISYVGETAYTEWVTGDCITDRMFFDQGENTVAGPYKGPLGYYITRVNRRTPPSRPLNLSEPRHMQLLKDDYLRWAFDQYTKEAVAKAEVRGWHPN
ncbi:MAG: hypothetical protein IPJ19_07525 [Planctomycetes bacterium]|nr:hypothetical protein [Planctomycetota bacterium]